MELVNICKEAGVPDGVVNLLSGDPAEISEQLIESDIADMKNTGGRFGGAITAALLLENFVEDLDWVHLDIAGPARASNRKGATGFSVLTLFEFFKDLARNHPGS